MQALLQTHGNAKGGNVEAEQGPLQWGATPAGPAVCRLRAPLLPHVLKLQLLLHSHSVPRRPPREPPVVVS